VHQKIQKIKRFTSTLSIKIFISFCSHILSFFNRQVITWLTDFTWHLRQKKKDYWIDIILCNGSLAWAYYSLDREQEAYKEAYKVLQAAKMCDWPLIW